MNRAIVGFKKELLAYRSVFFLNKVEFDLQLGREPTIDTRLRGRDFLMVEEGVLIDRLGTGRHGAY